MRRAFIALVALLVSLPLCAQQMDNRAEWRFSKSRSFKLSETYLETGIFPTVAGIKDAGISFRRKGKIAEVALNEKGYPTAASKCGDYWLFEVPSEKVQPGTVIDLFIPFIGNEGERNNFMLEYSDGKRWHEVAQVRTTTSHKHPERLWQSVRLENLRPKYNKVSLRLRQLDKTQIQSAIACLSPRGQQPQIVIYDNAVPRDTLKMLFLGNSYTYYHTYPAIMKEIAWREGHYVDGSIFISGGYTMKAHMANKHSMEKVDKGGYDYVMLQDQSILPTLNGTADDAGSAMEMTKMIMRVRKSSPDAKVMLEITWGRRYGHNNFGKYEKYVNLYPHFYSDYDAMQNRLIEVVTAEAVHNDAQVTPVGYAWQIVMHERPDINLYHNDNHHQSYAGSYLAAAVAYLTVCGEKFGSNPADGKLDSSTAAYLRSVAERVVLGGEKWCEK